MRSEFNMIKIQNTVHSKNFSNKIVHPWYIQQWNIIVLLVFLAERFSTFLHIVIKKKYFWQARYGPHSLSMSAKDKLVTHHCGQSQRSMRVVKSVVDINLLWAFCCKVQFKCKNSLLISENVESKCILQGRVHDPSGQGGQIYKGLATAVFQQRFSRQKSMQRTKNM